MRNVQWSLNADLDRSCGVGANPLPRLLSSSKWNHPGTHVLPELIDDFSAFSLNLVKTYPTHTTCRVARCRHLIMPLGIRPCGQRSHVEAKRGRSGAHRVRPGHGLSSCVSHSGVDRDHSGGQMEAGGDGLADLGGPQPARLLGRVDSASIQRSSPRGRFAPTLSAN